MKTRVAVSSCLFTFAVAAVFSSAAMAATSLGSSCTATGPSSGAAVVTNNGTAATDGVITSWGANYTSGPPGPGAPLQISAVAPTGNPNEWKFVSLSAVESVTSASPSFTSHLPLKAGQSIAGTYAVGICDVLGSSFLDSSLGGPPTAGATFTASSVADKQVALWAKVEPDADGDGYGDETQDQCPQLKETAGACVTIKPSTKVIPATNAFKLLLAADQNAIATATGKVTLPGSKGKKAKKLTFTSKATSVAAGSLGVVTLKYPSSLKNALKSLSKSKSLRISISVSVDGPLPGSFDALVLKYTQKAKGTN